MIEHPNNRIGLFLDCLRPGDTVYIHPEAEYHPSTTLQCPQGTIGVSVVCSCVSRIRNHFTKNQAKDPKDLLQYYQRNCGYLKRNMIQWQKGGGTNVR